MPNLPSARSSHTEACALRFEAANKGLCASPRARRGRLKVVPGRKRSSARPARTQPSLCFLPIRVDPPYINFELTHPPLYHRLLYLENIRT